MPFNNLKVVVVVVCKTLRGNDYSNTYIFNHFLITLAQSNVKTVINNFQTKF